MSKLIVVGIDFSKGSMHAFHYALRIARHAKSDILMVWVGKGKDVSPVYSEIGHDPKVEVKRRFEELMELYKDDLPEGKITYKIRSGKVYRELVNQAKYFDAWLVIAGTHGTSGFEEFWIGSNAYRIVTHAPCPVITIRYGETARRNINKIVMPIDNTRQTRQKVKMVAQIAELFDAEVHLLSLYSSGVEALQNLVDLYSTQAQEYLEKRGVKLFKTALRSSNLTSTTIDFAKEINADLIAIMTEQEPSGNILLGPYAQQMVNHSPVAVLSVHARNIYDYKLED